MLIKPAQDLRWSDVTPKKVYLRRREFIRTAGLGVLGGAAGLLSPGEAHAQGKGARLPDVRKSGYGQGEMPTAYDSCCFPWYVAAPRTIRHSSLVIVGSTQSLLLANLASPPIVGRVRIADTREQALAVARRGQDFGPDISQKITLRHARRGS